MKKMKKLFSALVLSMLMSLCFASAVFAITLSQGGQTTNSVTLKIDPTGDTIRSMNVTLYKEDAAGNRVAVTAPITLQPTATSYTFTGIQPGTTYRAVLNFDYIPSYSFDGTPETDSDYCDLTTMPGKVTGLKQDRWRYIMESVDFSWNEQSACYYEWEAYSGGSLIASSDPYSPSSLTQDSLSVKNNKVYTLRVRAMTEIGGQKVFGEWSDFITMFTTPMIKEKKGITVDSKGRMKIKWEKIDGVDSYDVYVSTKELTGYKKVKTLNASKGSVTVKKLGKKKFQKKKTYYVYVVANKYVNGGLCTSGRLYSMKYRKGKTELRWSFTTDGY